MHFSDFAGQRLTFGCLWQLVYKCINTGCASADAECCLAQSRKLRLDSSPCWLLLNARTSVHMQCEVVNVDEESLIDEKLMNATVCVCVCVLTLLTVDHFEAYIIYPGPPRAAL